MNITVAHIAEVTHVAVSGSIDALSAEELAGCLESQIAGGSRRLVLDLAEVGYMGSAGVRVIVVTMKESRQKGGDLCIAAPQPGVEKVLDLCGLTTKLRVLTSLDEAIASLG